MFPALITVLDPLIINVIVTILLVLAVHCGHHLQYLLQIRRNFPLLVAVQAVVQRLVHDHAKLSDRLLLGYYGSSSSMAGVKEGVAVDLAVLADDDVGTRQDHVLIGSAVIGLHDDI